MSTIDFGNDLPVFAVVSDKTPFEILRSLAFLRSAYPLNMSSNSISRCERTIAVLLTSDYVKESELKDSF